MPPDLPLICAEPSHTPLNASASVSACSAVYNDFHGLVILPKLNVATALGETFVAKFSKSTELYSENA